VNHVFQNRKQAGSLLATHLKYLFTELKEAIVLALPRGGVPIGFEISQTFGIPLDVLIVRKIGHPSQPEYGIGAVAEEGYYWTDPDAVGVTDALMPQLKNIIAKEKKEIERRVKQYRNNRKLPSLKGKTVFLVDDGLATGVTARVAAQYVKSKGAKKIILAIPVCSDRTARALRTEIDEVICLNESSLFFAVGQFYRDFTQVSDSEVMELLSQTQIIQKKEVVIPFEGGIESQGSLNLPKDLNGIVIFAHGSGSGRLSPRNQQVAEMLNNAGIGTLLFDLLTEAESQSRANVFDISLLAKRLISATRWVQRQDFGRNAAIGFFGASTGGGAALWAAADLKDEVKAVVSRGGRPDLAIERLDKVSAPTLLLVGGRDTAVISLNHKALAHLESGKLILIPGATHLFEEPGTLELVSSAASAWFLKYFNPSKRKVDYETDQPRI
jgi:putative phosphoribosyl transferase